MQKFRAGLDIAGLQIRPSGGSSFVGVFTHANLADRIYTMPDKAGTVAMISDINLTTGSYKSTIGGGSAGLILDNAAGNALVIQSARSGLSRWLQILGTSEAETGSNAGSNYYLSAYSDAGAFIDSPLSIIRAAGGVVTIARPLNISTGNLTVTNGNLVMLNGILDLTSNIAINTAPGNSSFSFNNAAKVLRWSNFLSTTETGSGNVGSDWLLRAYTDAGATIGNALVITRATMLATFGAQVTATQFNGSGAGITALTLPIGSINATGTPSAANYLCGNGTWAAVSASVTSTDDNATNATYYPALITTAGGSTLKTSSTKISFNPSTGLLTSTALSTSNINITGNTNAVAGSIYYGAGGGLTVWCKTGSTNDFSLVNPAGTSHILDNPTGTNNLVMTAGGSFTGGGITLGTTSGVPRITYGSSSSTGFGFLTASNSYADLYAYNGLFSGYLQSAANRLTNGTDLNSRTAFEIFDVNSPVNPAVGSTWNSVLNWPSNDTGYITQLANAMTGSGEIYRRTKVGGTFGSWYKLIDTFNISSQSVANATSATTLKTSFAGGMNYAYTNIAGYYADGSTTGTIKISLPSSANGLMVAFKIVGYDYSNKNEWELHIGGYVYSVDANYFHPPARSVRGFNCPFTSVRFAKDASGNPCILLGTLATGWSYESITITEAITGYQAQGQFSGTTISLIASESGYVASSAYDPNSITTISTVTALQFNGSGAGLTGTAVSLTANAVTSLSGHNISELTNNSGYQTGSGAVLRLLHPDDDRTGTTPYPNSYSNSLRTSFKTGNVLGGTIGNYIGVIHFAPYDGNSASTGDCSYQLAFGSTVLNGGIPRMAVRNGINTTWNAWHEIVTDANIGSQSVAYASEVNAAFYRADAAAYPVAWIANNGNKSQLYSCAAVTITSSSGTLSATTFSGSGAGLTGTANSLISGSSLGCIVTASTANSTYPIVWHSSNSLYDTAASLYVNPYTSIIYAADFSASSDERLKENWQDLPLDFVSQLAKVKVGTYHRIDSDIMSIGASAQSLQLVMPLAVHKGENDLLSISYGNAALVSAVELAKEIERLKIRIIELESKIA